MANVLGLYSSLKQRLFYACNGNDRVLMRLVDKYIDRLEPWERLEVEAFLNGLGAES